MSDNQRSFGSADAAGGRLERLKQQERVWFSWVCRLHDVHSGSQSPHSAAVLSVAQRRWAEVRQAIEREDQQSDRPSTNPTS
jgi:hypothetical protein